jgi:hypothetical protein
MIDDQDVRQAFARMVEAGPPARSSAAALTAGRRARRRRTLLLTGTAAAGVAAVLVAASAFAGLGRGGTTTPVASPAPSPTAAPAPVVPGISPAEARTIIARCLQFEKKPIPAGLQLFNAGPTPWGTRYSIYGPTAFVDCLHATEGDWRGGVDVRGQTQWLTGPLTVDRAIADGAADPRDPGTFTIQGRVVAAVAKVEIRYASGSMTVPAVNGTFMAAVPFPTSEIGTGSSSIRALDENGRVVYQSPAGDSHPLDTRCWVTPDGTVLPVDGPSRARQKCLPATRWR